MNSALRIGTSGWNYKHWLGPFYPPHFPGKQMLTFYSEHFDTVEVNNSFYHLPASETFENWRTTVDDDFCFALKASRFITHMKKLKAPKTSTEKFFARAVRLEKKLGPILFQLPPRWKCNAERLSDFLAALPAEHRYAFEFRDLTWFNEEIYALLKQHHAALCFYHQTGYDSPMEMTADFVYIRLHGTESKYGGSYPAAALKTWAKRIAQWRKESKDVFFYFNNDPEGHAVKNALTLKRMATTFA
jgi:uncharacterized protein YecE (DUF72 family)